MLRINNESLKLARELVKSAKTKSENGLSDIAGAKSEDLVYINILIGQIKPCSVYRDLIVTMKSDGDKPTKAVRYSSSTDTKYCIFFSMPKDNLFIIR